MGTPSNKEDWEASTYDFAGLVIRDYLSAAIGTDSYILDVGAGWGKYRFLFPSNPMDAVEIWEPYVEKNNLRDIYNFVYVADMVEFEPERVYDAIILGDCLEHISAEDAQKVIKRLIEHTKYLCVAVPFSMEQGEEEGNCHEIHIQDDLNEDVMASRFPELRLLALENKDVHTKAVYVREGTE